MIIRYVGLVLCLSLCSVDCIAEHWLAGFSRVDVTPVEPVRMAGYGSRDRPSDGVDTPLFARCFALMPKASFSDVVTDIGRHDRTARNGHSGIGNCDQEDAWNRS